MQSNRLVHFGHSVTVQWRASTCVLAHRHFASGLLCPCTNYRVSNAGFEPGSDAVPSPDVAGRAGGIGADIMGDMMDMMGAAGKGDAKRAAADIADMARHQSSGE